MHVHSADQTHNEVNNSVGVRAGQLSLRDKLISIALRNDSGTDLEERRMEGKMKEWMDGRSEGPIGEGRRRGGGGGGG